jgi:hypothetical protein
MTPPVRTLVVTLALCGAGCAAMAVATAPKKEPSATQTPAAKEANDAFWAALHAGAYADIPKVKELLQRAYLNDPSDAITAAHLGFLHIWSIAERARLDSPRASVTDDMLLAQHYFREAVQMTGDPRFMGFLAVTELANGTLHKDEKLVRTGYFRMKDAVARFPEFNLFARGYAASQLPVDSERFKAGLEDMWVNIDACIDARFDRNRPDYAPYMRLETTAGPKRVCWNGPIAPHNLEGFALNFGDMLVKHGDVAAARVMYGNAKLSRTFDRWPYRALLERRLAQADENVDIFRRPVDQQPKDRRIMFASEASCSGCHADAQPPLP